MSSAFSLGAFALTFLLAGVLTLIVGTGLVFSYRRAVRRYMRQRAGAATTARRSLGEILALADGAGAAPLEISVIGEGGAGAVVERSDALIAARRAHLRAAAVYAAAGFCHAGISIVLLFSFAAIEPVPIRTLVTFWAYAWPVPLTLILLWGPDRRRQFLTVLGYFAVLAACSVWVGAFTATPPLVVGGGSVPAFTVPPYAQPFELWALKASGSAFLLVFLNRRVRNVGPLILLFMVIALLGTQFVFYALQHRTVLEWAAALSEILERAVGSGALLLLYGLQMLGALLFAIPAWFVVRGMVRRYARKQTSDQAILIDSLWLFMTLFDCIDLIIERGLFGWSGLAAFGGYKLVTRWGLRPLQRQAAQRGNVQLLLLRVFGRRRSSERLLALLSARWRRAGSIQLIAGADLATTTLELHQFLDFLGGRLRRSFIRDAGDLDRRMDAIDLAPDPDGRFRINALFCSADTWQSAVTRLIGRTEIVLMDLRGFSSGRAGCILELQVLVDTIPLEQVVLLIDKTTDQVLLEKLLRGLARSVDRASPNRIATARLRLLRLDGDAAAGVREFLRLSEAIMATRRTLAAA